MTAMTAGADADADADAVADAVVVGAPVCLAVNCAAATLTRVQGTNKGRYMVAGPIPVPNSSC